MRLSATTTTNRRIKSKAKQTLQAPTATAASPAAAAAATTLATTTGTRKTAATRQIECFICNLIQLFLLTTTAAICTVSALGMAHAHAHALAPAEPAQPDEPQTNRAVMDAFSGQRFDQLPSDFASSQMLAASVVDVETAAAATTSAAFQFTTTHPHAHTHSHGHTTTTTTTATTLRVSYDSNEIDNSYAAAQAAAAAESEMEAADDGGDADTDTDVDDVERVADDYVMPMGQQTRSNNNENNATSDRTVAPKVGKAQATQATATTAAAATTTATTAQLMNAKTQDLLSLSQLGSSYQASTARAPSHHEKSSASSMKNAISAGSSATSPGGTFQQIGSQRINGNVPVEAAAAAATTTATMSGESSSSHHHHHGQQQQQVEVGTPTQSTSNIRTSARKVDSKFQLPKQQKTDAPMLNYIFDTHSAANKHHHHDQRYGPHFEDVQRVGQPTNLTVQAGSSIHLNCRISLLQDKTVSWVRRSAQNEENALDLLTVGLHAYTGDKRYKMEFQYPNNWRLKIINVKKDDEATYECQISTHPPRVIQINLHVNAPKVMIVDEYGDPLQEKYYEIDSTLQLSCVVRNVAMTSSVVYWKHSENVLNYDVTRGGVSVKTELMEDGANSTLSIAKIHKADSGNYTCSISEFQNFTIVVHILNGESFAELHHGAAGQGAHATWQYIIGLYFLLLLRWLSSTTVYTSR